MAERKSSNETELAVRLQRLSEKLDKQAPVRAEPTAPSSRGADYSKALRLSSEFIAAILVGAALGWGLDRVAGTAPWGMIVLLLLGFAAGVMTVMRSASAMTGNEGPDTGTGSD